MTKMKKLFAVVLALAMLLTVASFSASAEEVNPVTLTVPETVTNNGAIEVVLAADNTVGGMQATVTYNKDAVKLLSTSYEGDANTEANTVLDDKNGTIKVVVLGSDITFEFVALGANVDSVTFTAVVKASNTEGNGYAYEGTLNATAQVARTAMPIVKGTKLRETTNMDNLHLGFVAEVANLPEGSKVTEIGLVVIPTALLGNTSPAELTVATQGVLTASLQGEAAEAFTATEFVGYIKDTASSALMGKSFTARYYISVDGSEEKIYSSNFTFDSKGEATASYGTAKKSAVKLLGMYAKQIGAKDAELADDAAKVIADYNAEKTDANKQALVKFVFDNRALLG